MLKAILFSSIFLTCFLYAEMDHTPVSTDPVRDILESTASASNPVKDCGIGFVQYGAEPRKEGAFPELNVRYYHYQVKIPPGKSYKFKVEGEYPHGRYMGFNIYDKGVRSSYSGISDKEIVADVGSQNPFLEVDSKEHKQNYTIWVIPEEHTKSRGGNQLIVPKRSVETAPQVVELWYRIYLPDKDADSYGGVKLPKITSYDAQTGEAVPCPERIPATPVRLNNTYSKFKDHLPYPDKDTGKVHFYSYNNAGYYANRDTRYIGAQFRHFGEGQEVAVLKFKPPTFPKMENGKRSATGSEDVRYWSFSTGSAYTTTTSETLSDRDFKIDSDGMVTLVLGPNSIREEVKAQNMNFISHSNDFMPTILYRQLLARPDFKGRFENIPVWPPAEIQDDSTEKYELSNFLKEYCPQGNQMSLEKFRAEYLNKSN